MDIIPDIDNVYGRGRRGLLELRALPLIPGSEACNPLEIVVERLLRLPNMKINSQNELLR